MNDVSLKEGSSKPKVTLSFELSRSGLIQLNKAEAKVEELVYVDEKVPKSKNNTKASKTKATNTSAETEETTETKTETEE